MATKPRKGDETIFANSNDEITSSDAMPSEPVAAGPGFADLPPVGTQSEEDGAFLLDMSKADEQAKPMAAGSILVVSCTAAEAKISGAGNPMIALRVRCERVEDAHGASDAASYRNRSIRDNLMFIPPNDTLGSRGTLWRAKQAFDAFGIDWPRQAFTSKSAFMSMLADKAEALIGAVCRVEIGIDDGTAGGTRAPQINPTTNEPYPPKNTITRYMPYTIDEPAHDEDLPF